jgi:hypothetical protein
MRQLTQGLFTEGTFAEPARPTVPFDTSLVPIVTPASPAPAPASSKGSKSSSPTPDSTASSTAPVPTDYSNKLTPTEEGERYEINIPYIANIDKELLNEILSCYSDQMEKNDRRASA